MTDPEVAPPDLTSLPGFSSSDLVFNDNGSLSPDQTRLLRLIARGSWVAVGMLLLFGLAVYLITRQLGVVLVFTIVMAVFALYWAFQQTMFEAIVSSVDGAATLEVKRDSEGPDHFYIHIAGMRLETTKAVYERMPNGEPYRVYFIRRPMRAVNARALPGWKPGPPRPVRRPLFERQRSQQ